MDASRVGLVAAALMDSISEEYGEEVEVGEVAVVVELKYSPTHQHDGATQVIYRCSDTRGWVQRGLLNEAKGGT